MKKIFVLLLFSGFLIGCQKKPIYEVVSLQQSRDITPINVGVVANDHTGDPLRTAFIKVNNNFSYHSGLIALKANLVSPTFIGNVILPATTTIAGNTVPGIVGDTLTARIAAATPIGDLAPQWPDTLTYMATKKDIKNLVGSGAGLNRNYLQFIIGTTTGAPANADTSLVHASLAGKEISAYRGTGGDLHKQYFNSGTANIKTGYCVYNNSTGEIRFRPALATGDRVFIIAEEPVNITWLYPSGAGGASVLLDSLLGYWKLDEVSGYVTNNSVNEHYGNVAGTVNEAGKIGKAILLNGSNNHITVSATPDLVPSNNRMTVVQWVYINTLPSVIGHVGFFFHQTEGGAYNRNRAFINTDNYINFSVMNSALTEYWAEYPVALSAGQWYHVVFICRGDGKATEIWLDGAKVAEGEVFYGSLVQPTGDLIFGAKYSNTNEFCAAITIDEIGVWSQAFTAADVALLYKEDVGRTHPFIE